MGSILPAVGASPSPASHVGVEILAYELEDLPLDLHLISRTFAKTLEFKGEIENSCHGLRFMQISFRPFYRSIDSCFQNGKLSVFGNEYFIPA